MTGAQDEGRRHVARFLEDCRTDAAILARYADKPLPDLVLQARCEGYAFGPSDLGGLIGELEVWTIMTVAAEPIDASSSLWRRMWGRRRLDYVVQELWAGCDESVRRRMSLGTTEGATS